MKRVLSLITLLFVLLCSCAAEDTEYSIQSFDSESRIQVAIDRDTDTTSRAESNVGESRQEVANATFLIKDKAYKYQENDVVLLDITNETQQNLSITITMVYYDEAGTEIKTEERFFEQFAAGYQNYFLFQPNTVFDDYSYTVNASVFDGEVIITKYDFAFVGLEEDRTAAWYNEDGMFDILDREVPTLEARITFGSTHTEKMYVNVDMLLFNAKDELVAIQKFGPAIDPRLEIGKEYKNGIVYQTKETPMVWPEQYQGEIRAVFCYIETKEWTLYF